MLGLGLVLGLFSALLDMLRTRAGCSFVTIATANRALYCRLLHCGFIIESGHERRPGETASPFGEITIRYDTIRDAILTCARKLTQVSIIYRTEPTTEKSSSGYAAKYR